MSLLTEDDAAAGLSALGSPVRLRVFRLLVRAGDEGANVTDLVRLSHIPPSTLAHHLAALSRAGLVRQEKRGRELICTADYGRVNALAAYLTENCCAGLGLGCAQDSAA